MRYTNKPDLDFYMKSNISILWFGVSTVYIHDVTYLSDMSIFGPTCFILLSDFNEDHHLQKKRTVVLKFDTGAINLSARVKKKKKTQAR